MNRTLAIAMLEYHGCRAQVAAEGKAALHSIKQGDYDLLLMDCEMRTMDGYEATREIRRLEQERRKPRMPIIALTAHVVHGSRERCLAAGMDDYISKPFTAEELEEMLGRWLA